MRYLLAVTLSFIVSVLLSASVAAADHGVHPLQSRIRWV